jgi:hypothetical protein
MVFVITSILVPYYIFIWCRTCIKTHNVCKPALHVKLKFSKKILYCKSYTLVCIVNFLYIVCRKCPSEICSFSTVDNIVSAKRRHSFLQFTDNIVYAIGHISLMLKVGNIVPTFEQEDRTFCSFKPCPG